MNMQEINNYTIQEALKYLSLGFSVMPLGEISKEGNGKKVIGYPRGGWKQYQEVRASEDEVMRWNCKNLGIVTGKISNLVVLDLDEYKKTFDKELVASFHIPITPMQRTASGGKQYFFKYPKDLVIQNDVCIGSEHSGIDIRGEGGMVIVAPSSTSYGDYKWEISPVDEPLAEIPEPLLHLLSKKKEGQLSKKSLPELMGLEEGEGRNNAMAALIGKLLRNTPIAKWDEEVWVSAQVVNQSYNPPLSIQELSSIYQSITKIERTRRQGGESKVESLERQYVPAMSHGDLMNKEFPSARYTIEPFFEQASMNMVSAPPNTWKSWLLFLFANNIARGTAVFGEFKTEKTNVMIVNEEDPARLIQDRLRLLGVTDSTLGIYYRIAQGSKLTVDYVESLIAEAKEKAVGVIMFDSLRAIHVAEENDSTAMQEVMDLFKKIVREDITVIFTHHHRKRAMMGKNDDAESSRGSTAINAAVGGHISLDEKKNGDDNSKMLVIKHLKSKVGEKLAPIDIGIEIGPVINFTYLGKHEEKSQVENEARIRILEELGGRKEMLSRKDFISLKIAGQTTIKNVLKLLVAEGSVMAISRKEAQKQGVVTLSEGKANEWLYSLSIGGDSITDVANDLFTKQEDDY